MRRRTFLSLLAGAASGCPLTANAQQTGRTWRIGVITGFAEHDPESQRRVAAFLQGLRALGWTNNDLHIDYRWGANDPNLIKTYAAELVAEKPDAILVNSAAVLRPVLQQTRTIPIVFVQINDPIGSGLITNLVHPGGNVTGFTPAEFSMGSKLLGTLKDAVPVISRVVVILDPDSPTLVGMMHSIESAAELLKVTMSTGAVRDGSELEQLMSAFAQAPNGGVVVLAYPATFVRNSQIAALALKYRLPAIYPYRYFVTNGGLMSYGVDPADQYRQAAAYVDRILKGANPGDLPVQQPTKFELIVNLKTAKALDLTISPAFLLTADEVIE